MKYLKMFEALEESIVSEIKKIIADNQYITDKDVNEEKLIYSDKWIIFISKDTLAHIKSHMGPSKELGDAPGSYYTANWKEGIKNAISKHEPQVGDKPPFRTAWTGVDAGTNVGFVTIGFDDALKSEISEGYKSYTYERPVRGEKVKETIIVKNEEAEKTNFVTVVGSKIGEVGGKGLVSLWTAYPDYKDGKLDGKEIPMNRNEFQKNGFYFKCSKEFFEAVPAKTNESKTFRYLKTFESFSVNENTAGDEVYEDLLSWLYQSFLDLKLYFNKFGRYDFQGLVYPSDIVDIKGEKKNRHGFAIGIGPRFEMIELAFGLPKGTFKVEIIGDEMPSDEDEVVDGKIVVSGETLFTFTSNYEKFDDDISLKIDWLVDESGKTFHQFGFVQSSENNQQSMANLGNKLDIILKKVYQSNKDRFTVEGLQQLKMNKCETDR